MANARPSPSDCLRRVTNTVFNSIRTRKTKDQESTTLIPAPSKPTTSTKCQLSLRRTITGQEPPPNLCGSQTIEECSEKPEPAYITSAKTRPETVPITTRPSLADLKVFTRRAEERAAMNDGVQPDQRPRQTQKQQRKCSVCKTLGTVCEKAEPCGYCRLMGREQRCSYPQPQASPPNIRIVPPTPSSPIDAGFGS